MGILVWLEGSYGRGGGLISGFVGKSISNLVNQRLKTKNVLQKLAFVSLVVRHTASLVQLQRSTEVSKRNKPQHRLPNQTPT
jgi:hypothetical protein